jgi:hypothetical protein
MLPYRALFAVSLAFALTACGRDNTIGCEATERYSTAQSVQPVQIPDDLSPPDETAALRLPPDPAGGSRAPSQPCLESPPSFFGEGRPGRTGRPASAEPPPAAETPAANPERAIDN